MEWEDPLESLHPVLGCGAMSLPSESALVESPGEFPEHRLSYEELRASALRVIKELETNSGRPQQGW